MNNPLVSVIIPAYNHQRYVGEAITSVIEQSYSNIELIIIDDGSTDETYSIILEYQKNYAERFHRFMVVTQENMGTASTVQKLVAHARGYYVAPMASDDRMRPSMIEDLCIFLQNNPNYILAVGDNEIIDTNSCRIGWNKKQVIVPLGTPGSYATFGHFLKENNPDIDFHSEQFGTYASLIKRNYIPNGWLIRRDALRKINAFTEEAPLEDWYLHLQLSKLGAYAYIDKILFSYRWHSTNSMRDIERIWKYSALTLKYELECLKRCSEIKFLNIAVANMPKPKIFFSISNILVLSKFSQFGEVELSIKLLSHTVTWHVPNVVLRVYRFFKCTLQ